MKIGESQFCEEKKFISDGYMVLNAAIAQIGHSFEKAAAAIYEFAQIINKIIPKEYKIMKMKLTLMEARLHTLEGRSTECEAIRKKLRRQIRNLKAAMNDCLKDMRK